ncbi:hypothetical protein [Tenacibaculum haliotis]|uniref:hypothetical protein n=1 Tax=Tenacibaculum haliotis TaxID=1888914 RepID=UPI0021AEF96A|nr:hypothetical protein [Tenacibaculum haliotis]MCT4698299.1 hypothetical protein [Tenacibaculum haliotis]
MIFKIFKIAVFSLLTTGVVFAQKYDKKFSENFTTNKDVVVKINASNADIDVTTWNKNQVSIEAVIEVEGLDKKAAEKYFKNWQFEALGNKNKVQINASTNNFHSFDNNNFVFFNSSKNNLPKVYQYGTNDNVIVIPEIPEMPEIPEIEIPEINFEEIVTGLENIEFDFDKYTKDGKNYFFQWKDGVNDITIKSKKEWEKFKKTKKYKKFKETQEQRQKKLKKELKKLEANRVKHDKELKRELARARAEIKKINREEIKRELANAKKEIHSAKKELKKVHANYMFFSKNGEFTIDGKKVKITKKIIIKVPKNAKFDLNTRHCKVKLPKTKASGKVSYGTFKADNLSESHLNLSFSPVTINSLNKSTLFLNNVTDANLASVTNTKISSTSSEVVLVNVYNDVEVNSKFGGLKINKIHPNYHTFKVDLNSSEALINIANINKKLAYVIEGKARNYPNKPVIKFSVNDSKKEVNGNFSISTEDNMVKIIGKYSQLVLQK